MGKRPDYRIKAVYRAGDRKPFFSEIGAGWTNKNNRIILELREVPREKPGMEVMIYLDPVTEQDSNTGDDFAGPFQEGGLPESDLI